MYCRIQRDSTALPVVIRERNIKEDTFDALVSVCAVSHDLSVYLGKSVLCCMYLMFTFIPLSDRTLGLQACTSN